MEKEIIIKFGEIFLKGENKRRFEKILLENVKSKISRFGDFTIKQMGSVFSICGENLDLIFEEVSKVFGISSLSLAWKTEKSIDLIKEASLLELKDTNVKSFKIETKRADKKFYMNSLEICKEIGSFVVDKLGLEVDVHCPDIILNIEIRNNAYVFSNIKHGLGGLPVGTSGLGTVLISGGIDGPVASFMMAKRGLRLNAIHFSTPPYTSLRSVDKVKRLLKKISEYSGTIKFFNVNFSRIQKEIKSSCSENLTTIISRRFMTKISQKIAFSEKSSCLITGESLGQVASQTVASINCTGHDIDIPIFRPLIGMDKSEIVDIARKIGTFDISIEAFEDCCSLFSPKNPKINPILKFVRIDELKVKNADELINDSIKNCEVCEIVNE